MKVRILLSVGIVLILAMGGAGRAQQPGASMEEASQQFDTWLEEIGRYISDHEFDRGDMESFVKNWHGFSELGEGEEEEDAAESWAKKYSNLDWILEDPRYRAWAADSGVDPDDFLRKGMRIMMMVMRDQMQAQFAKVESQLPRQRAMIEEQCKNVAPEMCQQMKQAFEASIKMMGGDGVWDAIPEPTSSERSLLEEYQGQLLGLMNAGE